MTVSPSSLKRIDGGFIKKLPINTFRKIRCETDAANDYLKRNHSPGWAYFSDRPSQISISTSLNDGIATFTLSPSSKTLPRVGQEFSLDIGFDDNGPRGKPITFNLTIKFIEEQETQRNPHGTISGVANKKDESFADPTRWVYKKDWDDYNFDETSGAKVRLGEEDDPIIYVNYDHEALEKMRKDEQDEAKCRLNEIRFRICLGFLTFAIYKHHSENEEEASEKAGKSSDAIAPYVLSLIGILIEGERL